MPAWDEYKAIARDRGALALEFYVVWSWPCAAAEVVKEVLPAHLAYQQDMETAGHLAMAGPLSDESGQEMQGAGMIIYRAESMEAARAMAEADPMHARGARRFDLRKWLVNEGGLTVSVGLSTKAVGLA